LLRKGDGTIALTWVFDFAPMLLHPDGIARRMRWAQDDNGSPRWASVVRQAAVASGLPPDPIVAALREMAPMMKELPLVALDAGVDRAIVDLQERVIDDITDQLARL
jgi:serine/threonine-protein kinase HipA